MKKIKRSQSRINIFSSLLLSGVFFAFCSKEPNAPDLSPVKKELRLVRTFETWQGGIILSNNPTGITFHQPSGHLFITDSEINEISEIWNCENVFEVSLAGDELFNTFDVYAPGGNSCPANNKREPTGITFSEFDGFFYVTDDNDKVILRYDGNLSTPPLYSIYTSADDSTALDPEGITCNPKTGNLYVVSGKDGENSVSQILVYNSQLEFITNYIVADRINDPEGIAYSSANNHLYIVSAPELKIFEYTLEGAFIEEYDISRLSPKPHKPNDLVFAPSSNPADKPSIFNLYIVDSQVDNNKNPAERDGIIYEVEFVTPKP